MGILEDLAWRGLIADCTDRPALAGRIEREPIVLYCGFDPTAESLHVGNLVPLLTLRRFQLFGHRPIAVAGGATGLIGDPSGRDSERQLLSPEAVRHNIDRQKVQLQRLLDFGAEISNPAVLVDNSSWTAPVGYLEFLRDVGKHFTVNVMVGKESVRARMEDRESGLSYTEFSYMLLQAFDFLHLRRSYGCELQIGGSDQWGNITAGIDLIRKKDAERAYGLTVPLVTDASGQKFGKSTGGGSVWLDPAKTSPYRFYQFFMNVDDRDVLRFLKFFTFLSAAEIEALGAEQAADPGARPAQKALAREFTTLVHGPTACADAVRASEIMFGGGLEGVGEAVFLDVVGEVPTRRLEKARFAAGMSLPDALVFAGLSPSKGQARKDMAGGGIYLNNRRVAEAERLVSSSDLLFGRYLLLRKGKRTYALIDVFL